MGMSVTYRPPKPSAQRSEERAKQSTGWRVRGSGFRKEGPDALSYPEPRTLNPQTHPGLRSFVAAPSAWGATTRGSLRLRRCSELVQPAPGARVGRVCLQGLLVFLGSFLGPAQAGE